MSAQKTLLWFRQDLRLSDNPALSEAVEKGTILPLYILDDENAGDWKMGAASRWWLHHSLKSLNHDLRGHLVVKAGDPSEIIPDLVKEHDIDVVYWNRCYEPWRIQRDKKIKTQLQETGLEVESFNGSLLWEPWNIKNQAGEPYKVFTPYYRKGCLPSGAPREPLSKPDRIDYVNTPDESDQKIDAIQLLPQIRWDQKMESHWNIGEDGAQNRLEKFLESGLEDYKEGRNFPAQENVSRLSPHLHWGEISPNQAWYAAKFEGEKQGYGKNMDHFLSELGWREFSYNLLYHFPHLPEDNLQDKFDAFPWEDNAEDLKRWQNGETGYPIVDAAMREIWETGYMHNRCRMIVGSFLVKNLLLHWHYGEAWFWDCLVDADLASNAASWQWIAGCGADAAPYFRIFNPIMQGEKFDPNGDYVRHYLPELKHMPNEFIHKPWEASPLILEAAGVQLGKNYPKPIIDHKEARNRALSAYDKIKKAA